MASKEPCGDVIEVNPGRFTRPCGYPSKATRYQKDHTYPMRVCGIHGKVGERLGMPVVWDKGPTQ